MAEEEKIESNQRPLSEDKDINNIKKDGSVHFIGTGDGFKDEDDMVSDSPVAIASQQSIKAYILSQLASLPADMDTNGFYIWFDSGKGFKDENGNELLLFEVVGSAISYLILKNKTSGGGLELFVEGGTNEDLLLTPKGSGAVSVKNVSDYENNVTADDDLINKKYFADNQISSKVHIDTSQQDINNSQSETTLYSFTLPANLLGTNNGIRIFIPISLFRFDSNSENTFVLALKYDDTTVATASFNVTGGVVLDLPTAGYIEIYLAASGATNTQKGTINFFTRKTASGGSSFNGVSKVSAGTAAEDSTGNLTVTITGNFSTAVTAALNRITCEGCFVTKIA